jgi:hypothetical protein
MFGQIAYHLLNAAHVIHAPWEITTAVSCLPVVTLGFAAALIHLLHLGHEDEAETELPQPEPAQELRLTPGEAGQLERELDAPPRPTPRLDQTMASKPPWEQPYVVTHPQRAAERSAPWEDDENWTRPAPPQAAAPAPEPDTEISNQVVGSVQVRSPLSRLDRKIPVDERVTGSFPAIRD